MVFKPTPCNLFISWKYSLLYIILCLCLSLCFVLRTHTHTHTILRCTPATLVPRFLTRCNWQVSQVSTNCDMSLYIPSNQYSDSFKFWKYHPYISMTCPCTFVTFGWIMTFSILPFYPQLSIVPLFSYYGVFVNVLLPKSLDLISRPWFIQGHYHHEFPKNNKPLPFVPTFVEGINFSHDIPRDYCNSRRFKKSSFSSLSMINILPSPLYLALHIIYAIWHYAS